MYLPKHPLNTVQDLIASLKGGCLFLDTIAEKTKKTTTKHNNFGHCCLIIGLYTWQYMIISKNASSKLATNHNKPQQNTPLTIYPINLSCSLIKYKNKI